MAVVPLILDIAIIFVIIACFHYHYGNWRKHHVIVTVATFLSWFLPSMIIFVLPIDVSSVSTVVYMNVVPFSATYHFALCDLNVKLICCIAMAW